MRLAANFNHAEARRALRKAQRLDPNCAMCFAAEALILGPNINVPMDPLANPPALEAIRKAQALAAGASDKERGFIEAVAARYADDPAADRAPLNAAFADKMAALSDKYPDDLELAALAAEAGMDTQPWDYWEPGGKEPKGRTADVLKRLEGVLAKRPDHPWAIHLYIHLVEASDRPERAEPYADRLAALMPGAGHIVHMPSHIYYRIGRYTDSLQSNIKASAVDEAYLASTGAVGVYPLGYYSHNVHFVLVSAQLLGDAKTVLEQADKLDAVPDQRGGERHPDRAAGEGGALFRLGAICRSGHDPGQGRAGGRAGLCQGDVALCARHRLRRKEGRRGGIGRPMRSRTSPRRPTGRCTTPGAFRRKPVLEVAENVVRARAAQAADDQDGAIALLRKAAETEDTIPYMEPPYWYYPVRQSLGAALLQTGKAEEATKEFETALEHARGSAWALFGLKEAAKARGDAAAEAKAAEELAKAWRGDPAMLTLGRL